MASSPITFEPLLEQLHQAALGTLPWDEVLGSVTRLFQADSAVITVEAKSRGGWGISTGADARTHADYFEHYAGIHPLAVRAFHAPVGSVLTDRMLMPRAEYEHTEFYADWARPLKFDEMLHVRLESSEQTVSGMGITRSSRAGEFEAADFEIIRHLAPHVRRAIATYQRLSEALTSQKALTEALDQVRRGVLALDGAGRIVFANQIARSLLAAGDALRVENGTLVAIRPNRSALQRMIGVTIAGGLSGPLALGRPHGRLPLVLETVQMNGAAAGLNISPRPALLLLIDDPEDDRVPAALSLREFYGLTATEAAVAIHAARGAGMAAVALALGIAPSTARSHLKRVFNKTDTHRQAELGWLLARLSG